MSVLLKRKMRHEHFLYKRYHYCYYYHGIMLSFRQKYATILVET